ncbi:hypothetical protein CSUI_003307, partial [Cystoisospora suis]
GRVTLSALLTLLNWPCCYIQGRAPVRVPGRQWFERCALCIVFYTFLVGARKTLRWLYSCVLSRHLSKHASGNAPPASRRLLPAFVPGVTGMLGNFSPPLLGLGQLEGEVESGSPKRYRDSREWSSNDFTAAT